MGVVDGCSCGAGRLFGQLSQNDVAGSDRKGMDDVRRYLKVTVGLGLLVLAAKRFRWVPVETKP